MSVYYTGEAKPLSSIQRLLGVNTEVSATLLRYAEELKGRISVRLRGIRSASAPSPEEERELTEALEELDKFTEERNFGV